MSSTTFWNYSTPVHSFANELAVIGTSNYALATVSVFQDGVFQGTTTTDASGNWKYFLLAFIDGGSYNIRASMTNGSPLSNIFTFYVDAQITGFTNTPGNTFSISGYTWTVQSAAVSYNITNPDTHTLRFEIRSGERYPGDFTSIDRCELLDSLSYSQGVTMNFSYQFMYEAGSANAAGQRMTHLEMRNQDNDLPTGIGHFTDKVLEFGILAEKLSLGLRYCPTNLDPNSQATSITPWTSATDIVRGQWYRTEIEMKVVNDATGFCRLWLDGVQVVNYSGSIGYGPYHNFFRAGLIRNTQASIQSLRLKNFLRNPNTGSPPAGVITQFSTTPSSFFRIGGFLYAVETIGNSYSMTNPDSTTLRFEIHQGDHWINGGDGSGTDRTEVQDEEHGTAFSWGAAIPENTAITLNYQFMIESNSGGSFVNSQNSTNGWFVIGQMHNDDIRSGVGTSPPMYLAMEGNRLAVVIAWVLPGGNPSNSSSDLHLNRIYTATSALTPNIYHSISCSLKFSNVGSGGYCQVSVDGVQVVNYSGPLGFGVGTYWEYGIYRSSAPEVCAARYQSMDLRLP